MEMNCSLTLFNEKRKTSVWVFLIIYVRVDSVNSVDFVRRKWEYYPIVMVYSLMNEAPGCRWFM